MGENFLLVNTFFGNGQKETLASLCLPKFHSYPTPPFLFSHFVSLFFSDSPTGRGQRGILPGPDS